MSDPKDSGANTADDLQDLARRFQDLWRDQMAATAADPEFIEMIGKWMTAFAPGNAQNAGPATMPGLPPGMMPGMPAGMMPGAVPGPANPMTGPGGAFDPAAWTAAMQAAMAGVARKDGSNDRSTGAASAGAKAASDASGAGNVAIDEFERRVAALEQRLGRLEAALEGAGRQTAKRSRGRKS